MPLKKENCENKDYRHEEPLLKTSTKDDEPDIPTSTSPLGDRSDTLREYLQLRPEQDMS